LDGPVLRMPLSSTSVRAEYNKAIPWTHCLSAAVLWQWSITCKPGTRSTASDMDGVMLSSSRKCGICRAYVSGLAQLQGFQSNISVNKNHKLSFLHRRTSRGPRMHFLDIRREQSVCANTGNQLAKRIVSNKTSAQQVA